MTRQIDTSLEAIDNALGRLDRVTTLRLLQPGLIDSTIEDGLRTMKLAATPDLAAAYRWHNGTNATTGIALDDLHLFPGFYFVSLEDAMTNYRAFKDDPRWNPAWLPVFANGGGDFLAIDCLRQSPDWGGVVHFRIDEAEQSVEYSSVGALLATVAAAYKAGIYFVDENGYLEMDDLAFVKLAAGLNPNVDGWRQ